MEEPIRVAQIIGKAIQTGVDTMMMNYYRNIDRNQVQFDFFMDGLEPTIYDDEIPALGGRIFKLPPYEKNMRDNLRTFREILQKHPYKIVHSHMNALSVFWLREAKKAKVPVRIAHSHSTASRGEGLRVMMKYSLRPLSKMYPTHLAACSQHAGTWLFGKNTPAFIIYNAFEVDSFRFDSTVRDTVRTELNLTDKYVIGHAGRFVYQKNHHFLINVFKEVLDYNPQAVLLLIGDGDLRKEAENQTKALEISDSVVFLGTRKDMHLMYQAMDVFALPSNFEGLGMVAVEAQVSGLPCFLSEAVPREAGLVKQVTFLPLKIQDWAAQIIALKPDGLSEQRNNPLVIDNFDIQQAAPRLCEYYKTTIKEVTK
ncbi:MAG: glycosyltransferase family 1 protein [Defluviitaleaceae bacterium]|nr:glycosyltransferase family 1 protein [Defluviitaleaceae bacterium]